VAPTPGSTRDGVAIGGGGGDTLAPMDVLGGTRIRREATPATVNLRRCKLVVTKGAQRGTEFVVASDVLRVGKAPDNDLVVSDETVSRTHFEIVRDAKGYLVRDLHSTNGTFLDGAEIKEAYLRAGSVVGAGAVELKFTPFEERIEILPSERETLGEMVGQSTAMREIFGLIERIAPTDATVLIEGETGTGKDMIARTLHLLSRRKDAPFVVDCGRGRGHAGSRASCSATRRAPSPGPRRRARAPSSWPPAAPSSSTSSASCRSTCSPSCCACSSSARSAGSVARRRSRSTCE
jgi:pSer/pThr/pTyr-binding forkhead associated (FHA) protein